MSDRVEFDGEPGSGANSCNIVLVDVGDWMTVRQVEDEVRRRKLPTRGAVRSHLDRLVGDGYLEKESRAGRIYYRTAVPKRLPTGVALSNPPVPFNVLAPYVPDELDERRKSLQSVSVRPAQSAFRDSLIQLYGCQCQITGTRIDTVLEACHICGYLGDKDNHIENGLILRSDIHKLFDQSVIGIDPNSLTVRLNESVRSDYRDLDQKKLRLGKHDVRPSGAALQLRWEKFVAKLHG